MESETPQPPSAPTPPESRLTVLVHLAFDTFCEWTRLKALGAHLKAKEFPHFKDVWISLVTVLALSGIGGCSLRGCVTKWQIAAVNSNASKTNSFLIGVLTEKSNEAFKISKQLEGERQENTAKITDLRIEFNETKRQKDADMIKLLNEKTSIENRLSKFEAMPSNILALYAQFTNFFAIAPTNRDELFVQMSHLESVATNFLADLKRQTAFAFVVNGHLIDKDTLLTLPFTNNTTELTIMVQNMGEIISDGLAFSFTVPSEVNLLNINPRWKTGNRSMFANGRLGVAVGNCLTLDESGQILPHNALILPPFSVQYSNLEHTVNIVNLRAMAKNAPEKKVDIYLRFESGLKESYVGEKK